MLLMRYVLFALFSGSFLLPLFGRGALSPGMKVLSCFFLFVIVIAVFSSRTKREGAIFSLIPFAFLFFYGLKNTGQGGVLSFSNILFLLLLVVTLIELIRLRLWRRFRELDYTFFLASLFIPIFSLLVIRVNSYLGEKAVRVNPLLLPLVIKFLILYLGARVILSDGRLVRPLLVIGAIGGVMVSFF